MGKRSSFERVPRDFYPTPAEAVTPLLPHLPKRSIFIEPCAGDGALIDHLKAAGHICSWAVDIEPQRRDIQRADARELTSFSADFYITNPPFKLASEFVEKSLQLTTGKVAMFLRLAFLEGVERGSTFPTQPLARVWVMSRRVPMWRGEVRDEIGSLMAMAWFVWDHAHKGRPELGWLDWKAA